MDSRMSKELVIAAPRDAVCHTRATFGYILHSERGSRYCSLEYQMSEKDHGFIDSMNRKGNCKDNAPIEESRESFAYCAGDANGKRVQNNMGAESQSTEDLQ